MFVPHKLLAFTCLATLPLASVSAPFMASDPVSNAMGGTGVASADTYAASFFNPSLLAADGGEEHFGLQLPAFRFALDDSKGLIKHGEQFIVGGGLDEFQDVDTDALTAAIQGTGSNDALTDVMNNVITSLTDLSTASAALAALDPATNTDQEFEDATTAVSTASTALSNNSDALDDKVSLVNTQITNVDTAVTNAQEGLLGFSGKPLQFVLGGGASAALPSKYFGAAIFVNTDLFAGAQVQLSSEDLTPVDDVLEDMVGITGEASELTTLLGGVTTANDALIAHILEKPEVNSPADYPAVEQWQTELSTLTDDVDDAQTALNNELNETCSTPETQSVTCYEGNFISGGTFDSAGLENVSGDLKSSIEFAGANIVEVGISLARQFEFSGETINIGIVPKFQMLNIFDKTIVLGEAESESSALTDNPGNYFLENLVTKNSVNLDVGASKDFEYKGRVRVGAVVKNIIPQSFKSANGADIKISPQIRAGVAHSTTFTRLALDLDVTENKPLSYGVPTRYLGLGGELRAWNFAKLRLGYRNNLSVSDSSTITGGVGITPFGVGLDLAAWAKPTSDPYTLIQDMGFSMQFALQF